MGRKKIEIRPLVDERNRNVTFLKRKAGLMKKAWELSVLCGADISILLFSAAGKAYEFSSRDLDGEIDRYLEYEGLIERRRAEEFAAMAEAGEDDDDDDEDDTAASRRKSAGGKGGKAAVAAAIAASENGGAAGDKGKPVKSLKGKEVYKVKMPSRREIIVADKRRRKREKVERPQLASQGFIDGLLTDSDSSDGDRKPESSDMAGLNYAMSLGPSSAAAHTLASFPSSLPSLPYAQPNSSYSRHSLNTSPPLKPELPAGYSPAFGPQSVPAQGINYPSSMGGLQWDPALLQRYAEFQMQQNHQRQHRLLLQRQREQLALMGVGIGAEGERRLLDDIFGAGGASGRGMAEGSGNGYGSQQNGGHQSGGGGSNAGGDQDFLWPTFSNSGNSNNPNQSSSSSSTNNNNNNHHFGQSQSHAQTTHALMQQHQQHQQQQHQTQTPTHDTSDIRSNSYYPDEFEYDSRTHSHPTVQQQQSLQTHPTPGSVSTNSATPWYSGLGDLGGDSTQQRNGGTGDEIPYASPSAFEELIGRKRPAGDDANGGDKRIRV